MTSFRETASGLRSVFVARSKPTAQGVPSSDRLGRERPDHPRQPPDARFESLWRATGPALHGELRAGRRFVVHCRGGLGRAGTVAARLLIETGVAAGDAVNRVRAVRKGAIETPGQEAYLMGLMRSADNLPGTYAGL